MSEEFTNILNEISGGGTNKQVQELGLILSRTLEIVINAVDMLEENLNNINSTLNARIDQLEKKINSLSTASVPTTPPTTVSTPATTPTATGTQEPTEESATPPAVPSATEPAQQPTQVQATPAPVSQPKPAPKPISPINIRRALNTEIKQLFAKMRSQTEE
ncbi:MAG: hypothetical protein ACTSQY_01185 [Candidatus Odinarchaeia archaeon]